MVVHIEAAFQAWGSSISSCHDLLFGFARFNGKCEALGSIQRRDSVTATKAALALSALQALLKETVLRSRKGRLIVVIFFIVMMMMMLMVITMIPVVMVPVVIVVG